MTDDSEALARLAVFAGVFTLVALAEAAWPLRDDVQRARRWMCHAGLSVLNTGLVRVLALGLPVLPVAVATQFAGGGIFGLVGLDGVAAAVAGFVILDLAIYLQHVAFHHVPLFWRAHRVHHADTGFDLTTGIRFHPLEIVVSLAWKLAVVIAFGIPALAVLVFEIVLNAGSLFSHANLALPRRVERVLRLAIVTPDMHRVHHSVVPAETNSNFGFNLSLWDRLFGTYRAQSAVDSAVMPIGLEAYRTDATSSPAWVLGLPFRRETVP